MNFKTILSKFLPFVGLIFVIIISVIAILIQDSSGEDLSSFLSFDNVKTILIQTVVVGVAALGMTLVIISAGIDLSVGSQVALATVVFAFVINGGDVSPDGVSHVSGAMVALAILGALAACGFCGFINGFLSSKFKIVPFIVTLGTMQIFRGVAKWIAGGEAVRTPSNAAQSFMDYDGPLGIGLGFYILILSIIVIGVMLKYTVLGRYMYGSTKNIFNKTEKNKRIKEGECIFPFKYKWKNHTDCYNTPKGAICATEINPKSRTLTKYGYCKNSTLKSSNKSSLKSSNKSSFKSSLSSSNSKKMKDKSPSIEPPKKTMKSYNQDFIDALNEMNKLMILKGEPFRARAYLKAVQTIKSYPEPIYNTDQIKDLPHIGKTILEKLKEL
ncbi:MAG: hypothetical protein ABF329_06825, partial [Lentimonas sp.]